MDNFDFENISCPICNEDNSKLLYETKDYSYSSPGTFFIVKCCTCSFIYQNPRPKFENLWKYYPKGEYFTIPYAQNHQDVSTNLDINKKRALTEIARSIVKAKFDSSYDLPQIYLILGKCINAILGDWLLNLSYFQRPRYVKNGRLLEVGFGTCSDLIHFRNEGWDTFGADVDEDCCKYAKNILGFKILNINKYVIESESESFDVVYLSQTLEHLSYLNESLLEFNRLLKEDGQLIMKFPNINCLQAKFWKSQWRGVEAPRHLSYFSKATVSALLKKNGFKEIEVRSVNLSPMDIFCSNIPPTIKNNKVYMNRWWNKKWISAMLQLFAPLFGLGESLYVTAKK